MEHHPLWRVRPNHLATVGDDHLLSDLEHVPTEQQRSEEHTSELQSPCNLVCRLLLEKKKQSKNQYRNSYITSIIASITFSTTSSAYLSYNCMLMIIAFIKSDASYQSSTTRLTVRRVY